MKRHIAAALAALIITPAIAGCSKAPATTAATGSTAASATATSAPRKVRVAYYGGTCESPIYVAAEKEVFKKNGLDAELVKVDFETLKEGLATGKIDAVQVTAGELKPIEQGLDIRITRGVHTGCIQAVAPADSPIASAADLKGKRIGVEAIGGVPMTLLSIELGSKGIDIKKDVEWKAFPAPQLEQALAKGEIDAFVTWDPFGQIAVDSKKAKRIFSNTYDSPYKDQYCCFVGVNGQLAKDDPSLAAAITKSIAEGAETIAGDPKAAASIAVDAKYTAGDATTTAFLLGEYGFPRDGSKTKDSLAFWLDAMKKQGILESSTDPAQLLETVYAPVAD